MKEMRVNFTYDGKVKIAVFRGKKYKMYTPSASRVAEAMDLMAKNNITPDIGYTAVSFSLVIY